MEPMQCEESTRIVILEQLKRRELYVPNAQNLPLEELQQIFDGFIVPHPRRERRERQRHVDDATTKSVDQMPMEMENLMKRIKVVYVVGEKRPGNVEPQFFSCAAKRLRSQE
ncbi:uncharacterized protein LOC117792280 [Drosophila innubila]|uniref:uncharacterized protein LOC117792280 n=1 Tax=Drosophila innubila TaxID=198719 RepID=UPI00148CF177|nr:uncharacterized protein LOC117792280 [Drosophila innubila]XP_034488244.1 uncharacterized protein LOC117792280 [Drosophila innubila]